jgi:AraC-like DNA-binding protein
LALEECLRAVTSLNWKGNMNNPPFLTVGDLAQHFKVSSWKIRRIFERGLLPQPLRLGLYRAIPSADLHKVERALREAGYLAEEVAHAAS